MAALRISKKHHKHLNNPFPPPPRTLPQIRAKLSSPHRSLEGIFPIGEDFRLLSSTTTTDGTFFLQLIHLSNPTRPLWSTLPGQAFISAGVVDTEVEESRGSFIVHDGHVHQALDQQSVEDIRVVADAAALTITGSISSSRTQRSVSYWVVFDQKSKNQVGFHVEIEATEGVNRVCFTYASEGNERFFGFGEQFSCIDFKGKRVPIFVQEQGIGRGDQPATFAANLVSYR